MTSNAPKVIVTGGAGFIGSHLSEELVARGYKVVIVDDLSTGKLENIQPLLSPPGNRPARIEFVRGSITDLPLLQKHFQGAKYVFHQAALARVPRSIEDPLSTNEVNIKGTLNVLLAARDNGVGKVVCASSSSVYGNAVSFPQTEDLVPNPLSPYALTKLAGEYYCTIFGNIFGLKSVSLRYFNVYGPRQDPKSQYATVIAAFIRRISEDLPPIIHGDGEQSRDFTYIKDVVQANIAAAESDAQGIYNIGNGRSTTINRLAEIMLRLMKKDLAPVHQPPRLGDPRQTQADITRARTFGYDPQYLLEQGLEIVVSSLAEG
ncbi:MAG: SDR family oxidoreductase [Chloroflexi bacterium]|nr:SDR family oxidoreductase [Chloroflexota bacterium]